MKPDQVTRASKSLRQKKPKIKIFLVAEIVGVLALPGSALAANGTLPSAIGLFGISGLLQMDTSSLVIQSAGNMGEATVVMPYTDHTYTGASIKPVPTITIGTTRLVSGVDFALSYSDNVNAGTATLTIEGIGDYAGTITRTFVIHPASISTSSVALEQERYAYTGTAVEPVIASVTRGTRDLLPDRDYTVSYANNTAIGTGSVTLAGTGNYAGTKTVAFAIDRASLALAEVTLPQKSYDYAGVALRPEPTVTLDGATLVKGTDYDVSYQNNDVTSGTATVVVTGRGNYVGSASTTFDISSKRSLVSATVQVASAVYTGTDVRPAVTVTMGDRTLVEGDDYTLDYADNTNVGTASVTVTGVGDYEGAKTAHFAISQAPVANATITLPKDSYEYTGVAVRPVPTVTFGDETLVAGTDYAVAYSNNVRGGTATMTVLGRGRFTGSTAVEFEIVEKMSIATSAVSLNGSASDGEQPGVTVKSLGQTLTEGVDYTLAYATTSSEATVTVTGIGKFAGVKAKSFALATSSVSAPTSISLAVVSLPQSVYPYTGSEVTPKPTVTLGGKTLVAGTDYTVSYLSNVKAGVARVVVTGKGSYTGTVTGVFTIYGGSTFVDARVTLPKSTYVYTGGPITPVPTVRYNERTLVPDIDYTVSYSNNVNVGTATITIIGVGGNLGVITKTFTISGAESISGATVSVAQASYTGSPVEPAVTVALEGKTLVRDVDYVVTYANNVDAGTATANIQGIGKYMGLVSKAFSISRVDLSAATVTLPRTNYDFANSAIQPIPTVTLNGKTLTSGIDYTVTYASNTLAGSTASVTITGRGNYMGTARTTFAIAGKRSLTSANISLAGIKCVYSRSPQTPKPVVTVDGTTLEADVDYTLSYADNVNAGTNTATLTVTGKGLYEGSKSVKFSIAPMTLETAAVELSQYSFVYNGAAQAPEVTVTQLGYALVPGVDYTVRFSDNVKVGIATTTVVGTGNYCDSASIQYAIFPENAPDITQPIYLNIDYATYKIPTVYWNNKEQRPITLTWAGEALKERSDYVVKYSNNKEPGTATAEFTGQGDFLTTAATRTFTINKVPMSKVTVKLSPSSYTYDFSASYQPTPTLTYEGMTPVKGTDYQIEKYIDSTKAGTAKVRLKGMGDHYEGTYDVSYRIEPRSIEDTSETTMTLAASSYSYTGSKREPAVTLTMNVNGKTHKLTKNTDYTVTYKNNINVGTATVTVKGKGNFTGERTKTFTIKPVTIKSIAVDSADYTGYEVEPDVTVTSSNSNTLYGGYWLEYSNNVEPGTGTVKVVGDGTNVTGSKSKTFRIRKYLTSSMVELSETTVEYTGTARKPKVTVMDGSKKLTTTSYSVKYEDNIEVGRAWVTVTGKGNYTGEVYLSFWITE